MTNYQGSKYSGVTKVLLTVAGVCYVTISAILLISVFWMHVMNDFDILNLSISTIIIAVGMTKGIIALKFRNSTHEKATTSLGIMFILFGVLSFLFLFSLAFIIAGVLILISVNSMEKTAKQRNKKDSLVDVDPYSTFL